MSSIGERVLEVRKDAKLTQISFAKQIGISQTHVSKIEKGVEHPSKTLIKYISYRYNVDEKWLETGNGAMHPETNSIEDELIVALKRFETNIPRQFKDGDIMAVSYLLSLLYHILTIDMARDKYNRLDAEWIEFPAQYIDGISSILGVISAIATKANEYNTQKIDLEYMISFVKNVSKEGAMQLIKIAHILTAIPIEQFVQQESIGISLLANL